MFTHTPSIYGGQLVLRFRPHHPSWLDKRLEWIDVDTVRLTRSNDANE